MTSRRNALVAILLCGFLVALAWNLFVFGSAMVCCSQVLPNRFRWLAEKLAYGAIPACLAIGSVVAARRVLVREYSRRSRRAIFSLLVIVAGFLDFFVFWRLHNRYDDGLRREWNVESRIFDWGRGQVRIPPGFHYEKLHGIDTMMGQFISEDGSVMVTYDIGELAGEHGGMGRDEMLVQGFRVRAGRVTHVDDDGTTRYFAKASFPDCGCANFYLDSAGQRDQGVIEAIARSFRPNGGIASWLMPLLPEVWRTECRYRFRWPDAFVKMLDRLL